MTVAGIDISRHQGNLDLDHDLDLDEILVEGFRFCFVKMTEGVGYVDPLFEKNWELLENTKGLLRGAYHFARPDLRPREDAGREEAKWCLEVFNRVGGYCPRVLPLVLDFEKYVTDEHTEGPHGYKVLRPWIEGFIAEIRDYSACRPIVYTGRKVWRYETGIPRPDGSWDDLDWLADRARLWLVQYSRRGQDSTLGPRYPIVGWPWLFWQWSGGGDLNFYGKIWNRSVDVNRFGGTFEELRDLCPVQGQPPSDAIQEAQLLAEAISSAMRASTLLAQRMSATRGEAVPEVVLRSWLGTARAHLEDALDGVEKVIREG